jgi:hypothetical protein
MSSTSAVGTTYSANCAAASAVMGTPKSVGSIDNTPGVPGELMTRDHALLQTKAEETQKDPMISVSAA